jgi:D-aminoacyl-tRNA deacylase
VKLLLQRVANANVSVDQKIIADIKQGILIFIAVEQQDTERLATKLAEKVANYRMFADEHGKMNLNVQQTGGEILVVSQFTLAADTNSGLRPSFSYAANHQLSQDLYQHFCQQLQQLGLKVSTGQFAANMQVSLTNDGPVTFNLSA